ncbi:nitric oxide-sensing protein NosP [Psychromonas sp. Urea-02u-13]|uniref:nitric oxide-sensing protein NosP n=1 Tax=Psychromonas sp. Urea-02u-13 TaxID=2058326 RepID=UPI000C328CCC|nr:nitric oxide-sensing protein NosP [Psychromonas sp. Urea-02u-13]PKG37653.1 GfdT protein [Psychromonas sp. Urea-02u-13]
MTDIKTITASSQSSDVQQACIEIQQQLNHADINFVLFYCSSAYSLPALAVLLQALFSQIKVVGCTSADEVSVTGNQSHSIIAIGFSSSSFSISAELIESMSGFDLLDAQKTINRLSEQCESKKLTALKNNTFLLTLLDGLSFEEEHFLAALNSAAAGIPHFGGSAGGDANQCNTHVYFDGQFFQHAAVVILINTTCSFEVFNCQHIKYATEKLVVTEVDVQSRTVYELNAEPAALEYARLLNLDVKDLCPAVFSLNPLAVKVGGEYYIRSIQKVNEADLSLTFYCAVDLGIVLTAVEMDDILHSLSTKLDAMSQRYGQAELVLACDCVLRRLEIEQKKLNDKMQALNSEYKIAGFNTYGEHINGIHLNQTFTGVYIAGGADE